MAFQNGLVAFLASWSGVHTAFTFDQTDVNIGADTGYDANSSSYAQAETGVYPEHGTDEVCSPDASGDFDNYIVTDCCMLLYIPSNLPTGIYGLFSNGYTVHGQGAAIRSEGNGTTITLGMIHNENTSNVQELTHVITERGWVIIGFQFQDNSDNLAIWVNGANVEEAALDFAMGQGSYDPCIGDQLNQDFSWGSQSSIDGSGLIIALFVVDNPNLTNTDPPGNGDSFYTDFYAAMLSGGAEYATLADTVGITDTLANIRALARSIADTIGITTVISNARSIVKSISDTIGITTTTITSRNIFKSIADNVGITDVLSKSINYIKSLADTVGITDVLSKALVKIVSLADTIGIHDTAAEVDILTSGSVTSYVLTGVPVTVGPIDTTGATLLVAVLLAWLDTSGNQFTDSKGNTWHVLTEYGVGNAGSGYGQIVYAYGSGLNVGSNHTFDLQDTDSGSYLGLIVAAISGIDGSSDPFGTENGYVLPAQGTTIQPGAVTPAKIGDLVVSFVCDGKSTDEDPNIDSGFTVIESVHNGSDMSGTLAFLVTPDTSNKNPTWTFVENARFASAIATFNALVGTGITTSRGIVRSILDTVGITDILSRIGTFFRTFTDTIGITTILVGFKPGAAKFAALADTVGITDVISNTRNLVRLITDSVSITDVLSRIGTFFRSFSNTVEITDSISTARSIIKFISDTVGITTSLVGTAFHLVSAFIADTIGITTTTAATVIAGIKYAFLTSTVGITDNISRIGTFFRTIQDTVSITDILTRIGTFFRTFADTVGITTSINAIAGLFKFASLSDTVGITDVISNIKLLVRSVSDTIGITDIRSVVRNIRKMISDTIGITDVVSRVGIFFRTIQETVSITTILTSSRKLFVSLSDTIGITTILLATTQIVKRAVEGISNMYTKISGKISDLFTKYEGDSNQ